MRRWLKGQRRYFERNTDPNFPASYSGLRLPQMDLLLTWRHRQGRWCPTPGFPEIMSSHHLSHRCGCRAYSSSFFPRIRCFPYQHHKRPKRRWPKEWNCEPEDRKEGDRKWQLWIGEQEERTVCKEQRESWSTSKLQSFSSSVFSSSDLLLPQGSFHLAKR